MRRKRKEKNNKEESILNYLRTCMTVIDADQKRRYHYFIR